MRSRGRRRLRRHQVGALRPQRNEVLGVEVGVQARQPDLIHIVIGSTAIGGGHTPYTKKPFQMREYNSAVKNRPPYSLESVDNALRLLQLLRDQGRLRVTDAAAELGTARSTAHRLLSMLVYRDFATQDEHHGYLPGPALSAPPVRDRPLQELRRVLLPHLEALCERVGETVNLMVRVGTQTRFLASVESTQILRVGDRAGTVLPATKTSGGKALLATLSRAELAELYQPSGGDETTLSREEFDGLCGTLETVRRRGYGLNIEETETGVVAIGRCVRDASGRALAALTIAIPAARFSRDMIRPLARDLALIAERAEPDLARLPVR
jgi:IclR family transcriptional regulator, acetate operon repressor